MTDAVREPAPARARLSLPCGVSERAGGLSAALALTVTGLFFVFQSLAMDLGTFGAPGPGFIPLGLGTFLVLFASAISVDILRKRARGEPIELGHRDVLLVMGALIVVPIVFEEVGAYLTLGLYTGFVLITVARLPIWKAAVASAVGMVATWVFFGQMLGVRLPAGYLSVFDPLLY